MGAVAWQSLDLVAWVANAEHAAHNLRIISGDYNYIWQSCDWPSWRFDLAMGKRGQAHDTISHYYFLPSW